MNFERGHSDPKITMEIGNPILREFDKRVAELRKDLIKAMEGNNFLIKAFSYDTEDIKNVIPLIIRNYYEKKYGYKFYDTEFSIGKVDISEFTLEFKISSEYTSFCIRMSNLINGFIMESRYSTSFMDGDKQLEKILNLIEESKNKTIVHL